MSTVNDKTAVPMTLNVGLLTLGLLFLSALSFSADALTGGAADKRIDQLCAPRDEVLASRPGETGAHIAKADCLERHGELNLAVLEYRRALATHLRYSDRIAVHGRLEAIYKAQGLHRQAYDEYLASGHYYENPHTSFSIPMYVKKVVVYLIVMLAVLGWPAIIIGVIYLSRRFCLSKATPDTASMTDEENPRKQAEAAKRSRWKIEPELMGDVPRVLERRARPSSLLIVAGFAAMMLQFIFSMGTLRVIEHQIVLRSGVSTLATVQADDSPFKKGSVHLTFPSRDGTLSKAAIEIDPMNIAFQPGQKVNVHYLENKPSWVFLDDDGGRLALDLRWIISYFVIMGMFGVWQYRRSTRFKKRLMWDRPVAATVKRLPTGSVSTASIDYTIGDEIYSATCPIGPTSSLQPGDTVTAFIDPDDPEEAILYRESGYRVAGSDDLAASSESSRNGGKAAFDRIMRIALEWLPLFVAFFALAPEKDHVASRITSALLAIAFFWLLISKRLSNRTCKECGGTMKSSDDGFCPYCEH